MKFCEGSVSAFVRYKFPGGEWRQYTAEKTPVSIEIVRGLKTSDYPVLPYGITVYLKAYPGQSFSGYAIAHIYALLTVQQIGTTCKVTYIDYPGAIFTDTFYACYFDRVEPYVPKNPDLTPFPDPPYIIKVIHEGELLFSDQGDGLPDYAVICDCKDGELRIPSDEPPGYECFPIRRFRQRLETIKGDYDQQTNREG